MLNSEVSSYTISIYELMEGKFDFNLRDYEIFDESYRPILNNAILEFYKFREIGYANPFLWRDRLNARMNLIMRNKYNELYKAKKTEFNPLFNVDMTETFTHEIQNNAENKGNNISNVTEKNDSNNSGKTTTENSGNNKTMNLSSQFPSEEMTEDDLTENLFVDNAQRNTSESKDSSTENNTSNSTNSLNQNSTSTSVNNLNNTMKEIYERKEIGSSAGLPFSKALIQLKQFYDKYELDQQIINELKDLFMGVW